MRATSVVLPPVPSVLLAIASVQGGAAIAKGLFPIVGPTGAVGLRTGLSAMILLIVFRPAVRTLNAEQWKAVIPYGIMLGAMNLLFYSAIARIPLGLGVTIEFIGPLAIAVWASRRAVDFVWIALAGAGIALITPWAGTRIDPLGILFAALTGVCWGAYILLGERVSKVIAGGSGVAIGMLFALLVVMPFAVASGGLSHLTPGYLAMGFGLAVLSSALPFTLEMNALRAMSARTFSILLSLEPAVAALCGVVFLHEYLTKTQWGAVALVIVASVGATLTARKTAAISDPA